MRSPVHRFFPPEPEFPRRPRHRRRFYAESGIRFNTVSYGYIVSGMHKAAGDDAAVEALYTDMIRKTPMGRIGNLDEVVGAVIYLGSELASFQTGTDILVDGGISIGRLK